ncbi:MAG: DedA family protein [Candidatus Micrarchaeota archaeon]|nr:DedA family protein [Candidatus Micrarchaeota archaeon]
MIAILFSLMQLAMGALTGASSAITAFISSYGYIAVFILMFLESTGIPIPSEVLLPLTGHLVQTGVFNPVYAYAIVVLASILGIAFDYYIAYFLGKQIVYRHLNLFHIKRESLDAFDEWFSRNGPFTVFIARFIPEVRALISLPAGFAMMPQRDFFIYSIAGALIWDATLMAFGYYALGTNNVTVTFAAVAVFIIILYMIYRRFRRSLKRKN